MVNTIVVDKKGVKVSVSVYVFKDNAYDGDMYIAYCPSLDLCGYNTTEDGAKADFDYMLKDYLQTQIENGTLHKDLNTHGWRGHARVFREPKVEQLLRSSKQLRKVTELPSYQKINVNSDCLELV